LSIWWLSPFTFTFHLLGLSPFTFQTPGLGFQTVGQAQAR